MKKILTLTLITVLAFGFNACKKNASSVVDTSPYGTSKNNTNTGATPPPVDPLAAVGALPSTFTKKAVLEEFTGEWCGWCPEGAKAMSDIITANPGKVVGIAVHNGDPLTVTSFDSWLETLTGVTGFPNGSVDRANASDRGMWAGQVTGELAKTAKLGLAMVDKTVGKIGDVQVFIGYNSPIPSGSRLTLAVVEDNVPQSSPGAQHNYSTVVVVDANWQHHHVLRGLVSANDGDVVNLTSSNKYTMVEFKNIDLSTMNINNMANVHFAAFVNLNTGSRDVYNAQEAGLNETKKWD